MTDYKLRGLVLVWGLALLIILAWMFPSSAKSLIYLAAMLLLCFGQLMLRRVPWHSLFVYVLIMQFVTFGVQPLVSGQLQDFDKYSESFTSIPLYLLSLNFGYALALGVRLGHKLPLPRGKWDPVTVRRAVLPLMCVAVMAWIVFFFLLRTSPIEMATRAHLIRARLSSVPFSVYVRNFAIWASWAGFWVALIQAITDQRNKPIPKVKLAMAFVLLGLWMTALAQRLWVFLPAVSLLWLLSLTGKVKLSLWRLILLGAVGSILSYFLAMSRTISFSDAVSLQALAAVFHNADLGSVLTGGLANTVERVSFLQMVFDRVPAGILGGRSYLGVLTMFVPHRFASWRPPFAGAFLQDLLMPNASGGYDFTQIAEIYVNFGWAGIATVPILSGILLRALDTLVARGRAEPIMLLWFATAGFESAGVVLAPYGFGTYDLILYSVLSLTLGHMLRPHQPAMQPSKVLDTAS